MLRRDDSNKKEMMSDHHAEKPQFKSNSCGVYLAPSSVPGGGWGMYTARDVQPGEIILPADGPSIPIIDPDYSERSMDAWVELFMGYWWESGRTEQTTFESYHAVDLQITMGALPNFHPYLSNLFAGHPEVIPFDDSLADRESHPGAGAFSYYMGRHAVAGYRAMKAGEEIFLQYPQQYADYICDMYGIPKRQDYDSAGLILSDLLKSTSREEIPKYLSSHELYHHSEQLKALLPKSKSDLDQILSSAGGSYEASDLALAIAKEMSVQKRTPEWLKENGMCLDNILPGKSTNDFAGMGAIAQRDLKKGAIIVPAPLLQITDRDALRIPAFEGDPFQLLLNYCFGHDESKLLLCPNTNAILINHCSERYPDMHSCGDQVTPNAKYRWATWDSTTSEWLNKSIDEMRMMNGRGLSLEIVATRDIMEGEEIFIDYGEKWEKAWNNHVRTWKSFSENPDDEWKSAHTLNVQLDPIKVSSDTSEAYLSMDSREVLFTGCLYHEESHDEDSSYDMDDDWKEMDMQNIISHFGIEARDDFIVDDSFTYTDGSFQPCLILERNHKSDETIPVDYDLYTVQILSRSFLFDEESEWDESFPRIMRNFPRKSIRHFYLPYRSDIHLSNAFRHHIDLKDELFPHKWKDRVITE